MTVFELSKSFPTILEFQSCVNPHQDGVGAVIAKLLQAAGINTFDSLAQASSARIEGAVASRLQYVFLIWDRE